MEMDLKLCQEAHWMKHVMITLGPDDIERAKELCRHHYMNRSELIRYLLEKESRAIKRMAER